MIQGPSVSFMYELVRAADNMLKMASAFDTRLLVRRVTVVTLWCIVPSLTLIY